LSVGPLFIGSDGPVRIDFPGALHFSAATLSTVGYGDIQPLDDGVRLLATVEALAGQLLLLFGFYEIMRGSQAGPLEVEPSGGGDPEEDETRTTPPSPPPRRP
jgi:hypothetical protein